MPTAPSIHRWDHGELIKLHAQARARLNQRWLEECDRLLNEAGVPETVTFDNMPGNAVLHRLAWYLARRKNVSKAEARGEPV